MQWLTWEMTVMTIHGNNKSTGFTDCVLMGKSIGMTAMSMMVMTMTSLA